MILTSLAFIALGGELELAAVDVYPSSISLESARDTQRLLVLATLSDGTQRDLTSEAVVSVTDSNVAELQGGLLVPRGDGSTELVVQLEGQERRVPIEVRSRALDPFGIDLDADDLDPGGGAAQPLGELEHRHPARAVPQVDDEGPGGRAQGWERGEVSIVASQPVRVRRPPGRLSDGSAGRGTGAHPSMMPRPRHPPPIAWGA